MADYSALLVGELGRHFPLTLITSPGARAVPDTCKVRAFSAWQDAEALFTRLSSLPPETVLLWQYVPHMYGRGGVAPAVAQCIQRLHSAGYRQLVTAHEIAAPYSLRPNRAWYAWSHRQQWQTIVQAAEVIITSTEAWRDEWQTKLPQYRAKIHYAASPSTIPVQAVQDLAALRRDWRQQHGWPEETLVLGWFGTASAAKQLDWVLTALQTARTRVSNVALILIGKAEDLARSQNSPWIKSTGYLPTAEVSQMLQSIDLLLLPFIDGVSERRTSFMAGLSHGTPVVTTYGHNTGPTLKAANICALASAQKQTEFVSAVSTMLAQPVEREALAARGRSYYQTHYDWPVVVHQLSALISAA